jgi:hypothetical protein
MDLNNKGTLIIKLKILNSPIDFSKVKISGKREVLRLSALLFYL